MPQACQFPKVTPAPKTQVKLKGKEGAGAPFFALGFALCKILSRGCLGIKRISIHHTYGSSSLSRLIKKQNVPEAGEGTQRP